MCKSGLGGMYELQLSDLDPAHHEYSHDAAIEHDGKLVGELQEEEEEERRKAKIAATQEEKHSFSEEPCVGFLPSPAEGNRNRPGNEEGIASGIGNIAVGASSKSQMEVGSAEGRINAGSLSSESSSCREGSRISEEALSGTEKERWKQPSSFQVKPHGIEPTKIQEFNISKRKS